MSNETAKKILYTAAFLIWSAIVLSTFYITQRPVFFQVIGGILATAWAITLTLLLLINSAGIGNFFFERISPKISVHEKLILGTGFGLGVFGFLGYGLAAMGFANIPTLLIILFVILFWLLLSKRYREVWDGFVSLAGSFALNKKEVPAWLPPAIAMTTALGFFFALLPPAEGFDGLFYHLALPERLLADKAILPYAIPQFWFPSLIEGDFIWALGLGSERTAQLIHWSFSLLMFALVWEWARTMLGSKAAWWSLAVLASMPSLPWLASWAYSDMALTFYGLAALYTIWKWIDENPKWLILSGMFAGLAMGIKYTSFVLPVFCILIILSFGKNLASRFTTIISYSATALLAASPWYIRNWIFMGNPFYPFAFGGRSWDSFQSEWYAGNGTGIGWNPLELIFLPFNIMMGHRDQNFFDGRIGPFFLLLIPLAVWALWKKRSTPENKALLILTTFSLLNYLIWTYGVIQTDHLWQARLLWPGLIPLAIPIGFGVTLLSDFDLPRFRISFTFAVLFGLVVMVTLLDNSLSLIARGPSQYAFGMELRQAYFQRMQPQYTTALKLVESTPPDAFIYFLFEPRSYNMPHKVHPDPINNNLLHDFYLFEDVNLVINDWKSQGYTHILVFTPGVDDRFTNSYSLVLPFLQLENEDGDYKLYSIK